MVFKVESRGRKTVAPPAGIPPKVRVIATVPQGPQVPAYAGVIPTAKEAASESEASTVKKVFRNFFVAGLVDEKSRLSTLVITWEYRFALKKIDRPILLI